MPIKSIEKIKIGNYPYGKFANGYIYSAQIDQGYSENANKLTIDIVYENNAVINLPQKNLTTSYRVEFGDIVFPQMYFIGHSKSVGVNEETITCTFVDGSILLDRYFVGLTNRHYKINEQSQNFNVGVFCANCDNTLGVTTGNVTRNLANSPNIVVNNLLVVGDEEFIDQACDIPDVKYNFTDLLITMGKIPNFIFQNFKDINSSYKTSYTGTLREVLSNWCSDFGFSFYWDFITNSLICIDLRNPVDLTPVENLINENFNQNNVDANLPISSFSEDESLEGTYQQDNIDYVLKPSRQKEREIKDFFPIEYEAVPVSTSFPLEALALAKYNSEAFTLYCLENNINSLIGFDPIYVGINTYVLSTALQNIAEYAADGRAIIKIGRYNRDKDESAANIASLAAEDIGRYYYNLNYVLWKDLICTAYSKYNIDTSYEPQPIFGARPWAKYGGNFLLPIGNSWLIERSPAYQVINSQNFSIQGLSPIYMDIEGEVADQVRNALLQVNPNDTQADRYRGLTLIAYKPYLYVNTNFNYWNSSEENFTNAQYQTNELPECQTVCEKDVSVEICRKECTTLVAPGNGLISKLSRAFTFTNGLNGSQMTIVLPSQQRYLGYIKAEGSFTYTEPGIKQMQSNSNFSADPNVMSYSINLNDITTDEPSVGSINFNNIDQNSDGLDIKQKNPKKNIALKIIGMNYGLLNNYLNPESGLTSFNVYLNENGVFTDLNFENRPAKRPAAEAIMQKVGPQKTRIIK